MKHRTEEEIRALAIEAAERDLARLMESGLPLTDELIKAMARKAATEQAQADFAVLNEEQPSQAQATVQPKAPAKRRFWLSELFSKKEQATISEARKL